jgi:uncharacterized protein
MKKFRIYFILLLITMNACRPQEDNKENLNILVYTKTAEFRHNAIPDGLKALTQLSKQLGWNMTATEDSLLFTPEVLDTTDVVIFLLTSGTILGKEQQEAFQQFVTQGGGLVTIHSGTDTEKEWPWFTEAIGAKFIGHPPVQQATLIIENRNHLSTSFLEDSIWTITDEWYSFDRNPRDDDNIMVLISLDETSYNTGENDWDKFADQRMGDHPMAWCKTIGEGRVFQTALGHEPSLYSDPLFLNHIKGAIRWAGKQE